jgi:hypothetical protein
MGIPPRHRYRNRRQHHPLPAPTRRSTCERLLHTLVYTRVGKCPAVHGSRGCNLLLAPLLDRTGGAATRELPSPPLPPRHTGGQRLYRRHGFSLGISPEYLARTVYGSKFSNDVWQVDSLSCFRIHTATLPPLLLPSLYLSHVPTPTSWRHSGRGENQVIATVSSCIRDRVCSATEGRRNSCSLDFFFLHPASFK